MKSNTPTLRAWQLTAGLLGASACVQAASLVADFNGDGINDTATITAAPGSITIARGGGGTTSCGVGANWPNIQAVETDGVAGQELSASYADGSVWIIDDRGNARRSCTVPPVGSGRYLQIADFNGTVGDEIMFSHASGLSEVVDDRLRTRRTHVHATNGSAPSFANMDGVAGLPAGWLGNVWRVRTTEDGRCRRAAADVGRRRSVSRKVEFHARFHGTVRDVMQAPPLACGVGRG